MKPSDDGENESELVYRWGNGIQGSTKSRKPKEPIIATLTGQTNNAKYATLEESKEPKILHTTLHLKQTKSSANKQRQQVLPLEENNNFVSAKSMSRPTRTLQRQFAIQRHSKESITGDNLDTEPQTKKSSMQKNSCPHLRFSNGETPSMTDINSNSINGKGKLISKNRPTPRSHSAETCRSQSTSALTSRPSLQKENNSSKRHDEGKMLVAKPRIPSSCDKKKQLTHIQQHTSTGSGNGCSQPFLQNDQRMQKYLTGKNNSKQCNNFTPLIAKIKTAPSNKSTAIPEKNDKSLNSSSLASMHDKKKWTEKDVKQIYCKNSGIVDKSRDDKEPNGRPHGMKSKSVRNQRKTEPKCKKTGATSGNAMMADNNDASDDHIEFIVPLEPYIEVIEGSELELWLKIKGAAKVVWVKDSKIIPNSPPDFVYNSNSVDEIYSLRIRDVFREDSGYYICEAYGKNEKSDAICWCKVHVVEEEDDESAVELLEQPKRRLVVPLIITTSDSFDSLEMDSIEDSNIPDSVYERRAIYSSSSSRSSRETYEDALEDIHEVPDEDVDEDVEELNQETEPKSLEIESHKQEMHPPEEVPYPSSSCLQFDEHDTEKAKCMEEAVDMQPCWDALKAKSEGGDESSAAIPEVRRDICKKQYSSESTSSEEVIVVGSESQRKSMTDSSSPPKFLMGPSSLIVMLGETVNLRVKISPHDNLHTKIGWCKLISGKYKSVDGINGDTQVTSHIEVTQPTNDLVVLKLSNATYEDSGKYRVKMENPYGTDYHHCFVSVEGPPEPPSSCPVAEFNKATGNIHIHWSCCPFDGGSAITGYRLQVKAQEESISFPSEDAWSTITSDNFKGLYYTFRNALPETKYYFRVCVQNSHGTGKYSGTSNMIQIPKTLNDSAAMNDAAKLKKTPSAESPVPYEYKDVELKQSQFLEDYEKHEQLGKGRFGVVFKVTNKQTGNSFAAKFVKCRKAQDKERSVLEFKIMNHLQFHPKLICLVDAHEMAREIVIVTELINGGELFERVVADDFTLTERDCVIFLRQICDGVRYIHEKKIIHLDLKPENILCTEKNSNNIKIIDFGLAQYYNTEDLRVLFGTAEFVAPEIISYETVRPSTDMWSVGVICYILLSGLSPFLGDDDNETFSNITRADYDYEDEAFEKVSADAKDFISSLIVKRKEERLTAEECLQHKWLALSAAEKEDTVLSTDKLKRFLLRRKWQKTGNAIRALGRIATLYSSSRRSSSRSVPSLSDIPLPYTTIDSIEDSVFGTPDPVSVPSAVESNVTKVNHSVNGNGKLRYSESCRSDSGLGGDTPTCGSLSLD